MSKTRRKEYPKPPSMKWVYVSIVIAFVGALIAFLILYLIYGFAYFGNQIAGR